MKTLVFLCLVFVPAIANGQSIFVESTRVVPVQKVVTEYVEQTITTEYVPVSRVTPRPFYWNPECALSAAEVFQSCRVQGGTRFGCLFVAGVNYMVCSGSDFTRGPVRARLAGRRAVRQARRAGY